MNSVALLLRWKVLLWMVTSALKSNDGRLSHDHRRDDADMGKLMEPVNNDGVVRYDIRMPGVQPTEEDEYICRDWKVPEKELYIVKFEALADGATVHHLILNGCPRSPSVSYWSDCHEACNNGQILYAWARNAPSLLLPEDVGFRIGNGTSVKYLAIQIHYKKPFSDASQKDNSGIRIYVTQKRQKYVAGIFLLLVNRLIIPARVQKFHGDVSCYFEDEAVLHPFAFRTHAHSLGRVISGYVYNGSWHLLGKGNPRWPQAFWPITEQYTIKNRDALVVRCTYDASGSNNDTKIGSTHKDEMCNFYIMYYTDPSYGASNYTCVDNEVPDLASQLPADSDVTLPPNNLLDDLAEGYIQEDLEVVDTLTKKMESGELALGQVSGVTVGTGDTSVCIFHRGSRVWDRNSFDASNKFLHRDDGPIKEKTLVKLNASSGDVMAQWADGIFYMPHGLHIDAQGNFWVTDVALHQVMKFGPLWPTSAASSKPELVLGVPFKPGSDELHFCKPTDVAVLRSGEFFISDGYCNSRILKFSKDGKLMKQWGEHSSSVLGDGFPPPSTFDIPHSITALENRREICVADRENARVQCFTLNGTFLRQIHPTEFRPKLFALTYSEVTGNLYTVSGPSEPDNKVPIKGTTISMEDGKLISTWQPKTAFEHPHDVAVSPDGRYIYVVEIGPNRIWQFKVVSNATSFHQSVKKAGAPYHPISVGDEGNEAEDYAVDKMEKKETYFGATIIIGGLIVVPIIIMISVLIFLRLRRKEKQAMGSSRSHNRRFNLGSLLAGPRSSDFVGKDDEQRLELKHLQSDSEVEEYSSVGQQNA